MKTRFAFSVHFWGDGAVVARSVEDRAGPVVEQQFGEFSTWTQAQAFAARLNQGLNLDPVEAARIVTSSRLAAACVVREALNFTPSRAQSLVVTQALAAQSRFVLAELSLALTFCRCISNLSEASVRRTLSHLRKALDDSRNFLAHSDDSCDNFQGVAARTMALRTAVQHISARFPALMA